MKTLLVAVVGFFAVGGAQGAERSVSIGYLSIPGPWLYPMGDGAFERETGYAIKWVRFVTGAEAIQALHAGQIQIAYAGSAPIAVGISGGVDMELFMIAADIGFAEALIVHNQSRITEPRQLQDKRIGTPFWSTSHFHLLFALSQFNIAEDHTDIYHLTPNEIVDFWKRGAVDAAFVWYPALEELLPNGRILVWSEWLKRWGKATFDGFVVSRQWSQEHPEFVTTFVKLVDAANVSYRTKTARWNSGSRRIQVLTRILGHEHNVVAMMGQLTFPSLHQQVSPDWMGGGAHGLAAKSLLETSRFLSRYGMSHEVLEDYSVSISTAWIKAAMADQQKRRRTGRGSPKR